MVRVWEDTQNTRVLTALIPSHVVYIPGRTVRCLYRSASPSKTADASPEDTIRYLWGSVK
jgi:hypothetical protein